MYSEGFSDVCFCAQSRNEWIWAQALEKQFLNLLDPFEFCGWKSHWFSKVSVVGHGLPSQTGLLRWDTWVRYDIFLLRAKPWVCEFPPGHGVGFTVGFKVSASSTAMMWTFWWLLVWRSCSASFQVFFRWNCSMYSCRFNTLMGEGSSGYS